MVKLRLVSTVDGGPTRSPPRARSTRATPKSEQTRVVILEAAVDAINQHGIRGATLARVAETAGVTRGCLQYYFVTAEDIVIALAHYVSKHTWDNYREKALNPPKDRDLIEFAIDLIGNPTQDRYRVARLELLAAARTTPALQAVLVEASRQIEEQAKDFTTRLFSNPSLADTRQFRAARDLTTLVDDWVSLHTFPDDREARIEDVRIALRIALHTLWRSPSLDQELEVLRPRIRVKARAAQETPIKPK